MAAAGDMLADEDGEFPPFIKDRRTDYANTLLGNISTFKQNGEMTDVTVQLEGGKTIECHKILLAAASPYIRGALVYGHGLDTLDLTDQDPDVMEAVIEYIYSGRLCVPYELLYEFLNVTNFLQMNDVKEDCAEYLSNRITPRLSLSCYPLAGRMGLSNLQNAALNTIALYFPTLTQEPELLAFDHEELRVVFQLPNLQVASEDQVLDVLIRWTLYDAKNRAEQYFERLLQFVRIPVVSNVILNTISCSKKREYKVIKSGIIRRLQYLNGIKDTKPENLPKVRDSVARESMFIVEKGGIYAAELWPKKKGTFSRVKHLPYKANTVHFGVSLLPHGFILTGGNEQRLSSDEVYLFELFNCQWSPLPRMLTERDGHVSLSYGHSSLIVAGGSRSYTDNTRAGAIQTEQLMSVDRLDLLDMKWDRLGLVPAGYHCSDGAICGDRLYLANVTDPPRTAAAAAAVGPAATPAPKPLLECDLTTNAWQIRSALPNYRARSDRGSFDGTGGRLVAILDRLYLVDAQVPGLWKYLAQEDVWQELAVPLFWPCHLGATVFWRGRLYFAGDGGHEINEYDVKKNQWCEWENTKLQQPANISGGFFFAGPHCEY